MDITTVQGFTHKICGNCGVVFWVPEKLEAEYLKNGIGWFCPNGHNRAYLESECDRVNKKLVERGREVACLKTENITLRVGFDNRERELVRLRKKVKAMKKGSMKK